MSPKQGESLPWEDGLASVPDTAPRVSALTEVSCTLCALLPKLHVTI